MTTIKCPFCEDRVEGTSPDELTMSLHNHFVSAHELAQVCPPVGPAGEYLTPKERTGEEVVPERCLEGPEGELATPKKRTGEEVVPEVVALEGPERELATPKTSEEIAELEKRTGEELVPERYLEGPAGELATPKREEKAMVGEGEKLEEPTLMMNCPICGGTIRGGSEDELSNDLRNHMMEVHEDIKPVIKPKV